MITVDIDPLCVTVMPEILSMAVIRHLVGSDVSYDRVSDENGERGGACVGPHLA